MGVVSMQINTLHVNGCRQCRSMSHPSTLPAAGDAAGVGVHCPAVLGYILLGTGEQCGHFVLK